MFAKIVSVFVTTLAVVGAYTTPKGDPTGNPIYTPGQDQIVPVSQPFQITWNPTTPGTVTLVLLRGPSTNVVPLYPIAEAIANTGSFVWTPKSDLENDTTHYGLQLIVDATGQYQYSTQFGISNPGNQNGGASSSSSSMASRSSMTGSTIHVSKSMSWSTAGPAMNSTAVVVPGSESTKSANGHSGMDMSSESMLLTTATAISTKVLPTTSTRSSGTSTGPAVVNTNAAALVDMSVGGLAVGIAAAVFAL